VEPVKNGMPYNPENDPYLKKFFAKQKAMQ